MNIAIGFGSTESAIVAAEERAFEEFVADAYKVETAGYFTEEFVKKVSQWAEARGAEARAASKQNDKAEDYPARYSSWYSQLLSSASDLVLIVKFSHINRRHAMSPDGWALMREKHLFHVSSLDLDDARSAHTSDKP